MQGFWGLLFLLVTINSQADSLIFVGHGAEFLLNQSKEFQLRYDLSVGSDQNEEIVLAGEFTSDYCGEIEASVKWSHSSVKYDYTFSPPNKCFPAGTLFGIARIKLSEHHPAEIGYFVRQKGEKSFLMWLALKGAEEVCADRKSDGLCKSIPFKSGTILLIERKLADTLRKHEPNSGNVSTPITTTI